MLGSSRPNHFDPAHPFNSPFNPPLITLPEISPNAYRYLLELLPVSYQLQNKTPRSEDPSLLLIIRLKHVDRAWSVSLHMSPESLSLCPPPRGILRAEAEYRGVANAVAETCWLRNLLRELHTPLATATLVYCDNVSAVYLSSNLVQHQRTKHIEIDIHFVRDLVATGAIRVLHVPSRYQYADIFTKGLPTSLFDEFRTSLSVRSSPVQTAGECWLKIKMLGSSKPDHFDPARPFNPPFNPPLITLPEISPNAYRYLLELLPVAYQLQNKTPRSEDPSLLLIIRLKHVDRGWLEIKNMGMGL
ncbi:ribonuclease H-like domain-containing protein [Tanacetum coccineum]